MSAQFHDALWPSLDYLAGTDRKTRFPCLPRVDDLFASDQVSIEQARVVQQSAGDHYPVVATVSIIASEPERHDAATDSNQAQARVLIQQTEHLDRLLRTLAGGDPHEQPKPSPGAQIAQATGLTLAQVEALRAIDPHP